MIVANIRDLTNVLPEDARTKLFILSTKVTDSWWGPGCLLFAILCNIWKCRKKSLSPFLHVPVSFLILDPVSVPCPWLRHRQDLGIDHHQCSTVQCQSSAVLSWAWPQELGGHSRNQACESIHEIRLPMARCVCKEAVLVYCMSLCTCLGAYTTGYGIGSVSFTSICTAYVILVYMYVIARVDKSTYLLLVIDIAWDRVFYEIYRHEHEGELPCTV